MKAEIQNPLTTSDHAKNIGICIEFTSIANIIANAKNDLSLINEMDKFKGKVENFMWGFGSGHMWVKQIVKNKPRQQVLFVQY